MTKQEEYLIILEAQKQYPFTERMPKHDMGKVIELRKGFIDGAKYMHYKQLYEQIEAATA